MMADDEVKTAEVTLTGKQVTELVELVSGRVVAVLEERRRVNAEEREKILGTR